MKNFIHIPLKREDMQAEIDFKPDITIQNGPIDKFPLNEAKKIATKHSNIKLSYVEFGPEEIGGPVFDPELFKLAIMVIHHPITTFFAGYLAEKILDFVIDRGGSKVNKLLNRLRWNKKKIDKSFNITVEVETEAWPIPHTFYFYPSMTRSDVVNAMKQIATLSEELFKNKSHHIRKEYYWDRKDKKWYDRVRG